MQASVSILLVLFSELHQELLLLYARLIAAIVKELANLKVVEVNCKVAGGHLAAGPQTAERQGLAK